jgi:hypothetical protein
MIRARISRREPRVLDFDIETRKVGFFSAGRFDPDGCEPIAIAWSWVGKDFVQVVAQGDALPVESMLRVFLRAYDQADIVTGHYIRKFDLPILNTACLENGLPPLAAKWSSDTKLDMLTKAGISASQENLAAMYDLEQSKFHMNDNSWRAATRLTPEGTKLIKERVVADVKQHKALRAALSDQGFLGSPKVWSP